MVPTRKTPPKGASHCGVPATVESDQEINCFADYIGVSTKSLVRALLSIPKYVTSAQSHTSTVLQIVAKSKSHNIAPRMRLWIKYGWSLKTHHTYHSSAYRRCAVKTSRRIHTLCLTTYKVFMTMTTIGSAHVDTREKCVALRVSTLMNVSYAN